MKSETSINISILLSLLSAKLLACNGEFCGSQYFILPNLLFSHIFHEINIIKHLYFYGSLIL